MRLSTAIAFAFLALPAAAADSIADQAQAAFDVFAGGQSMDEFYLTYSREVLSGITGKWVSLNGPDPGTGAETYGADTEKHCKGAGTLSLSSPNPITLAMSASPKGTPFTQTYTLVSGAAFSQYTDPEKYFAAIGLGFELRGPDFDRARVVALSLANGVVQIYRPSADILVIVREKLYPTVLARCPLS
jgi:hypothetical protein